MDVELGIIEGYYGTPWTWQERKSTISFLASRGYRFYHYAPKSDVYLRNRWQEDHPDEMAAQLADLAAACRKMGVRFGVGLSPYEIHLNFDEAARRALTRQLNFFNDLGVDDLLILFDDMKGDTPELADRQAEIVHWAADHTSASRLLVCPSYYSDDCVLDDAFGDRPLMYLEHLGASLEPEIEIFWTGEEVCSRELSPGHLRRVGRQLGRKPFIWDNYPVNDGQQMTQYLHLRGFTGRPASIGEHVSAHGINPALQPTLTRIPALTLVESYQREADYEYGQAFRRAATEVLGEELAMQVHADLSTLQDTGLDRLDDQKSDLRERYAAVEHPGAREIVRWLDGAYRHRAEAVQTQ